MTMPSLLDELLDVSQQMYQAIEEGEIETFACYVQVRETLLERITAYTHPSAVDVAWERKRDALWRLEADLAEAMAIYEQRLATALTGTVRIKKAHQQYHQPPPPQRTILNHELTV